MKNYVHIGLGKTATSSLQSHIFSRIPRIRPEIKYNTPDVIRSIDLWMLELLDDEKCLVLQDILAEKNHFISREHLVNWNPRYWEESANKNLKLFGYNSTIIITIRETESYLRSLYQQIIHEGNIIPPNDFFVCSEEYDAQEGLLIPAALTRFDVDSFDLSHLIQIYEERFDTVIVVPMSQINQLEFMIDIFNLSVEEHLSLCKLLCRGKKLNQSYSKLAMNLTFLLSGLLETIGLEFRGSHSKMLSEALSLRQNLRKIYTPYKALSIYQKFLQFFPRVKKKLFKFINWRYIMQAFVSRYLSKKPYIVPSSCYRNIELAKKNDSLAKKSYNS